ncbi:MAG: hypothetical protein AABY06_03770 [Nanoarchaeota archaeon]
MAETPQLEIYSIFILPPDKEKKIESLEEKLGKCVLVNFGNLAYVGELCKTQENNFYIKYQIKQKVEEKIIEINSTNVIFVKQI